MGLENDLVALRDKEGRLSLCPVQRLLDEVQEREGQSATELSRELIEGGLMAGDTLCGAFRRNGYKISRVSILNHRKKDCGCGPQ